MKIATHIKTARFEWHTRHDPGCFRALAVRFWKIVLVACMSVAALSLGFVAWSMLGSVAGIEAPTPRVGKDSTEALSREQIRSTLELYEKRAVDFEAKKSAAQKIPDPSL
ncbi:MAG: hypothetical protein HYT30_01420 [Parcubacteria group bacterium]|nr:hypothetical protein [Parcubacteria group bacterium]